MLYRFTLLTFFCWATHIAFAQDTFTTHFEKTNGTETVTYAQGMDFLTLLDQNFECITLKAIGTTDVGLPLPYAILSALSLIHI